MYFLALFTTLTICVHLSRGTPLENNDNNCAELDKPDWKIDTLRNITLGAWPWSCLQSRYTNDSLKQLVLKSGFNLDKSVIHGFIGFVQFYVEKTDFPAGVNVSGLLREAAASGDLRVFTYLAAEKGIPVNKKDWNLLLAAASGGNVDLIKYLINEKELSTTSTLDKANTPVHIAAGNGKLEALRFFVETLKLPFDSYNLNGDTPALLAALSGNVPELKYLLEKGANANVRSVKNRTLLHEATFSRSLKAMEYLIEENRTSIDPVDADGSTPALLAATANHVPELKYLVEKGANLELQYGKHNQTILHEVVAKGLLQITKYLIEGANMSLEVVDAYDRTPLHTAARNGRLEMVKYLVDERKADLYDLDYFGLNLLHSAVAGGNIHVLKYLVDDMGMSSHLEDTEVVGLTVALQAARYGSVPMLDYLLNGKHANISAVDLLGRNLLHTAAVNLEVDAVKFLIEKKGFDVREKTAAGLTAFDLVNKSRVRAKVKLELLGYLKKREELFQ